MHGSYFILRTATTYSKQSRGNYSGAHDNRYPIDQYMIETAARLSLQPQLPTIYSTHMHEIHHNISKLLAVTIAQVSK